MGRARRGMRGTVILLLALVAGCGRAPREPETILTVDKNAEWHRRWLETRITELRPAPGGVRLSGTVFNTIEPQTHVVPAGFKIAVPDDHGGREYTLESISDGGVVFRYLSTFDHRSFGRNLVESDVGRFFVPCVPANAAAEAALKAAEAFVAQAQIDTARYNLSEPAGIHRITLSGREGWRVQWLIRDRADGKGRISTPLGGALNVIVRDSGEIALEHGR